MTTCENCPRRAIIEGLLLEKLKQAGDVGEFSEVCLTCDGPILVSRKVGDPDVTIRVSTKCNDSGITH